MSKLVKDALKNDKKSTARVSATAADAAGNVSADDIKVTVKPEGKSSRAAGGLLLLREVQGVHPPFDGKIDVLRGRLSEERSAELLRFWSREGALEGPAALRRLPEVVCVLRDAAGEIVGVNSVYPQDLGLIGGRSFWVYRSLLLPTAASAEPQLIRASFAALKKEFEPAAPGPVGLCVLVADPAEMERRPEALWPRRSSCTPAISTTSARSGSATSKVPLSVPTSQLPRPERRGAHPPLEDRYRIERLDETAEVTPDDVLALWRREGAMDDVEARRRLHEVELVAIDRDQGLVGVGSAYMQHNPQLRMDLWHGRVFVAGAHRHSNVGRVLMMRGRELLERRFISGEDTRAPGVVMEIENEGLKRYFNKALWRAGPVESTFIGENARGDHVRVYYFPGALAPTLGSPADDRAAHLHSRPAPLGCRGAVRLAVPRAGRLHRGG